MIKNNRKLFVVPLVLLMAGLGGYVWFGHTPKTQKIKDTAMATVESVWQATKNVPASPETEFEEPVVVEASSPQGSSEGCQFRADVCDRVNAYRELVNHWLDTGGWTDQRQEKFLVLKPTSNERPCIREKVDGTDDHICWNNVHFVPQHLYSDEVLRELSDTDPIATVILADRNMSRGEEKIGAAMYLRAAKMTGKPGPLVRFASNNRSFGSFGADLEYLNDRQPDPLELQITTYVYSLVADSLGYPLPASPEIRDRLQQADVPENLIQHAETTLHDQLLAYIRDDQVM